MTLHPAVAAVRLGGLTSPVTVHLAGGDLEEQRFDRLGPELGRPRLAADESDVAAALGVGGGDVRVGADGLARGVTEPQQSAEAPRATAVAGDGEIARARQADRRGWWSVAGVEGLDDDVVVIRRWGDLDLVLETRAATTLHEYAQFQVGVAFFIDQVAHFGCG